MTNYFKFLCSIQLLIVLLSYTDGLRYDERRYEGKWNDERQSDGRWNYGRRNDDIRYGKRWSDEIWDDRRSNSERRNDERWNDERWDDERSSYERRNDEIRNYDRRNDEMGNDEWRNDYRRNDERQNDDRRNDERQNGDRRNDERQNNDRRNDERQNNDRRNDERQNNDRRNDERQNNDRRNDERQNGDRRNDERQNGDRRNDERRNGQRRNDDRRNDERRNDDRGNDERRDDEDEYEEGRQSHAEKCPADKREDWSYRGNNGPQMWTRRYPTCGGRMQSPVAINSKEAIFREDREKLKLLKYETPVKRATLENDGHTIQMTPRDDVQRAISFDRRTYRLTELHFHWGNDKNHGSEHRINSNHYALEMHLVHQSDAGQTAVVAVFFKEQSQPSNELQNIIQNFPQLMYKDDRTELKSPININNLLPANKASYYGYEGSLTTPPCTEGVQWVLLAEAMPVGSKQMAEFRKLYSSSKSDSNEHCKISNNIRPLQPLNGRTIVTSK